MHLAKTTWVVLLLLLAAVPGPALAADIALMVLDANSYLANIAVRDLKPAVREKVMVVAASELTADRVAWQKKLNAARIIVVDVMGPELAGFLEDNIDIKDKTVYALRSSSDNEHLRKLGYIFDSEISLYYANISERNIRNMLNAVACRHLDRDIEYEPVQPVPQLGIYHPDAEQMFTRVEHFLQWQRNRPGYDRDAPCLGLLFFSSFLTPGQKEAVDYLIHHLEGDGFRVLPCFGNDQQTVEMFLLDTEGKARVDLLLAYSFKFYSALTHTLAHDLRKLDVPIVSAISLYRDSLSQWRESAVGVSPLEIPWAMATPEISGLIEPTILTAKKKIIDPVTGKTYSLSEPVRENIERLLPRLHRWIDLQRKPNAEKKIAILFYNHHQGKQNIGASYLNVFSSLETIFAKLAGEGYITGSVLGEMEIKDMIMRGGRNIGSWAPGELQKMVQEGEVVLLEPALYKSWYAELPAGFRKNMEAQWGPPENGAIMMYEGKIVIPVLQRGNIALMPEPARGWSDDPIKLYHDTTLYPHHQYLAAYLWLQKSFAADAMIHLGTHATYEWTPGKQAGLSPDCAPEILVSDIPNLYPYIVDDVGEALQAKRRGRGVMISHLTPMLRPAGLYEEYSRMAELASEYEQAARRGSATASEKRMEIVKLAESTGILGELQYEGATDSNGDNFVQAVAHYLDRVREEMIPYGMHSFGKTKNTVEVAAMAAGVVRWNPVEETAGVTDRIQSSAELELQNLVHGLAGRYVEPGEGNDPLRNPTALPTGRNLYGFNPNRLPSEAAWKLGRKAADEIIANHLREHGNYPNKVAVVLWAVELLRNEGVNESTILWLMGIRPVWLKSGQVKGLEVVSGKELGRPRIDVLINPSGLYRDLFPEKIKMLDEAVQLAIRQTDLDNFLAENSRRMKAQLIDAGMDILRAEEMSQFRIFSEESGSYGNGVSEMAAASGLWTEERQIVDVLEMRMGFAFGGKRWGLPAGQLFKKQLSEVEVLVHSNSSNTFGLLDNDDMFQYLGGLAMAVRHESGSSPETYITEQKRTGEMQVEDLGTTLGREIRSRYLNPQWIEGMQREDYAGARAMANYLEYLWGWQVTTPEKVTAKQWQQTYDVYVEDKYNLQMKDFFNTASPWAYQSMTARMLEAIRKGYWSVPETIRQKLAVEYAANVVEKGVACCDHTCNNPLLNQMVVSLLSLPGIMNPQLAEQFKLAVEQAARNSLEAQVRKRSELLERLAGDNRQDRENKEDTKQQSSTAKKGETEVEGYKMEKMESRDDTTQVTSSGVEWLAGVVVLAIIGLVALGTRRTI